MPRWPRYFLERGGRYYSRLVVPRDLRPFMMGEASGKSERRVPLGPDLRTALKKHHAAVASIQNEIAQAERRKHAAEGAAMPSEPRYLMSAEDNAREVYERSIAVDEDLRSSMPFYARQGIDEDWLKQLGRGAAGDLGDVDMHVLVGDEISKMRERGVTDVRLGTSEWWKLARAICLALLESSRRTIERNTGDFDGAPKNPMFQPRVEEPPHVSVSLRRIFDDYLKARAKVGRGRDVARSWPPIIEDLIAFIGHDDVTKYTKAQIRSWRDAKLETLSAATVQKKYLACIRAVLTWADENDVISENPARDVKQASPKKVKKREKGYTDPEATKLLNVA